jgi:hypothetical protein
MRINAVEAEMAYDSAEPVGGNQPALKTGLD